MAAARGLLPRMRLQRAANGDILVAFNPRIQTKRTMSTYPAPEMQPTFRPDEVLPGQLFLNRYQVVRVLGRGAMGEVVEVLDRHSGLSYALKRVPPELVRDASQMRGIQANFALVSQLAAARDRFGDRPRLPDPRTRPRERPASLDRGAARHARAARRAAADRARAGHRRTDRRGARLRARAAGLARPRRQALALRHPAPRPQARQRDARHGARVPPGRALRQARR